MADLRIGDKILTPLNPRGGRGPRAGETTEAPGDRDGDDTLALDGGARRLERPLSGHIDSAGRARVALERLKAQLEGGQGGAAHGHISQSLVDRLLTRPPV